MKFLKSIITVSSVFFLASCGASNVNTPQQQLLNLTNIDNQYALAASTGLSMLEETTAPALRALRLVDPEVNPDEELAVVNRYLALYKELTEEGALNVELAAISNRPEYVFQMTITTFDLDKNSSTFTLYFNEVVIASEDEIDEDIDDTGEAIIEEAPVQGNGNNHNYRHRNEERNIEDSTLLIGLVVTADEEFAVNGYRYVNDDIVRLGFKANLDDGRVLRISHMSSDNAQRLNYRLRDQGTLIASKKVFIANEDNKAVLKLEDVRDGLKEKYSFKHETDVDGDYYKIKFDTPEGKGVINVYITLDDDGSEILEYYFSGGQMYHHSGNGNHHGEYNDGKGNGNGNGNGNHNCPNQGDDEDYDEDFGDLDF